jgi:hypothetical protein
MSSARLPEPLCAVADLAGGEWPERARKAALEHSARGNADDASLGVRLLADCQPAFEREGGLSTKGLSAKLAEDGEAPWGGWYHGSPIWPRALADLLHRFGIRSRTLRLPSGKTPKGYVQEAFEDAWRRYLPAHTAETNTTPPQPASANEKQPHSIRHTTPVVAESEEATNPHESSDVANLADGQGGRTRLSASEAALLRDKVARRNLERENAERRERDAVLFADDELDVETARLSELRERFGA